MTQEEQLRLYWLMDTFTRPEDQGAGVVRYSHRYRGGHPGAGLVNFPKKLALCKMIESKGGTYHADY